MTEQTARLLDQLLRLPREERAELATTLLTSLHEDERHLDQAAIDAAWDGEIRRRVDRVLAGEPGIPWEEVRAKALERLHARRVRAKVEDAPAGTRAARDEERP